MQLIRTRPPKLSAARRSLLRFQRCSRYFEKLISRCQCRWQLLLSASLANVAFLNDVPCHSHHVRTPAREAVLLLLGCSNYGVDRRGGFVPASCLCCGVRLWRQFMPRPGDAATSPCNAGHQTMFGTPLLALSCLLHAPTALPVRPPRPPLSPLKIPGDPNEGGDGLALKIVEHVSHANIRPSSS